VAAATSARTNAFRILGKGQGLLVLFGDASKGWIAVQLAAPLLAHAFAGAPRTICESRRSLGESRAQLHLLARLQGAAKASPRRRASCSRSCPGALLIILGVWILLILLTRYVSVASIAASFVRPFRHLVHHQP